MRHSGDPSLPCVRPSSDEDIGTVVRRAVSCDRQGREGEMMLVAFKEEEPAVSARLKLGSPKADNNQGASYQGWIGCVSIGGGSNAWRWRAWCTRSVGCRAASAEGPREGSRVLSDRKQYSG